MKNRNIPCTECRKHRRKCIRTSTICDRCERLGKLCVQPTQSTTYQYDNDDSAGVNQLQEQVEQLEWAIQQMEQQMKSLSCRSNNSDSISAITRFNDPYNSPLYNDLVKNLMYSWQFQIKDGTFQIETGIRNVSDLLSFQFNTNSIPYLSPLSSASSSTMSVSSGGSDHTYDDIEQYRGGESGLLMQFGQESNGYFTFKLLTGYAKRSPPDRVTLTLPRSLLLDPNEVIDQLIRVYFSCHNTYQPTMHEASFMDKYSQLDDPLTDLMTLSLCCYTSSTPCLHLFYNAEERRNMADYFYSKAKSIILDQFDDPDKRLENVISINLISKYMHMTLKFKECKRLITIAYQICMDLKDEYEPKKTLPSCLAGHTHHPLKPEEESPNKSSIKVETPDGPTKDIDHVLFSRHVTITMCVRRFMDFVSNNIVDDSCFHFPPWLYAEDEPETTKRMAHSQNWVLGFFNLPFVSGFMNQVHKIHVGKTCTLTFESIVRLEDVINEWSVAMPEEFRLCADLKNEHLCREAIENTTDIVKLISFVHFHVFLIGIYSCLLQPIALGSENDQLLSLVQQHSLASSLRSCRLLIHTIHRMSRSEGAHCHYTLAAGDFLYHAIDVLILLSLSPNTHVAKEARVILKGCLAEIDCMPYMKDHRVPKSDSPIYSGLIDFNDPTTISLEFYDKYPQPWFAMMYDASNFITENELFTS